MSPTPTLSWWQRLLQAFGSMPAADPLPMDARRELDRWSRADVDEYHRTHGGEAPPDAPHIDEGGI